MQVLTGDYDGRTIGGLLKKVWRLEEAKEHRMAASVLKNWHSLLKLCETLQQANLQTLRWGGACQRSGRAA